MKKIRKVEERKPTSGCTSVQGYWCLLNFV